MCGGNGAAVERRREGWAGGPETDDERRAREQVAAKVGLYSHVGSYVAVILLLAAINLLTSPGYLWFLWPAMGWGIGVASHAFGILGKTWEERQVRALLGPDAPRQRERERAGEGERLWPDL